MIPNTNKEKSNALVKLTEPSPCLCVYWLFKHITTMLKTILLKKKTNNRERNLSLSKKYAKKITYLFF